MADEEDKKPKVTKRRRGNTLENWEIAIVKAMIRRGGLFTNDQDILAYFTRPTRSVNHRCPIPDGQPLIAKWGENLAAARFRDFALIAGAAHGIRIDDVAQIAEVEAAFAALSPDPVSPFETPEELTKFEADGCATCHVTRTYEVDGVTYMPLSDFLLHDLGDGEKRTAPLWGCRDCISGNPHADGALVAPARSR
ncbi:hypothetical protein NHN26_08005 [Rhodovulum tesquicola]|uniref:hypothetical protein n=1 Tax=Rhodovulum tesquicola TaxID=540254 RepID=UPI002098334E|nr:hypothetical protein [Rhodovulum tesquicola]MCO8145167.1 hypothetical protein [Rhodovulum tesquicola]